MTIDEILGMHQAGGPFSRKDIPPENVQTILRAGLLTLSGRPSDTVELYLADDEALLERLADARSERNDGLHSASLAIVVAADRLYDGSWVEHCSEAVCAMIFQAVSLGLSYDAVQIRGYRLSDGTMSDDIVKGVMDIPVGQTVYAVLYIGYPAGEPDGVSEELLWDRIHIKEMEIKK